MYFHRAAQSQAVSCQHSSGRQVVHQVFFALFSVEANPQEWVYWHKRAVLPRNPPVGEIDLNQITVRNLGTVSLMISGRSSFILRSFSNRTLRSCFPKTVDVVWRLHASKRKCGKYYNNLHCFLVASPPLFPGVVGSRHS